MMLLGLFSYTEYKMDFKTTNAETDGYVMAWFFPHPRTYQFYILRQTLLKPSLFSVSGFLFPYKELNGRLRQYM